ncbi:helix-turn-helix domain-containing protein [Actinorugispora endophytica]|uniref:helix-turn-helix domain-containing protein n=1 Tax=Actinorugispora endophytica TaxID=1605990 RepID=UPI00312C7A42
MRLRRLAAELRRHREANGWSVSETAGRLGWRSPKVSKIENGESRRLSADDLDKLLNLYGVEERGEREALHRLAKEATVQGWWANYRDAFGSRALPDFETEASAIRTYEALVVPGLLQTPEYAEAVFKGAGLTDDAVSIRRLVQARMERQHILFRPPAPHLWAVIDEAALRRVIGGREVMRDQLQHLVNMAGHHNVDLQVLPFSSGSHPALSGDFTLLEFQDPLDQSIVYVDTASDVRFLEKPDEIERYSLIFGRLQGHALSAAESPVYIRDIMAGLESDDRE